jgi:hypothetical protein
VDNSRVPFWLLRTLSVCRHRRGRAGRCGSDILERGDGGKECRSLEKRRLPDIAGAAVWMELWIRRSEERCGLRELVLVFVVDRGAGPGSPD